MKHLPKHLRPRWRYLAVRLAAESGVELDRGTLQRECWYTAQNLIGDAGSADVDLTLVDFEFADGTGHAIVRTRRAEVTRARAVLACVDAVDDRDLGVRVAGVSGTVSACREKFL